MSGKHFIVSLHDVAPSTLAAIEFQIQELKLLGVNRCSLLVVPYYHGMKRLGEDQDMVQKLREWQTAGHEIVLHGWRHDLEESSQQSPSTKPRRWFFENIYTSREAEFLSLDHESAKKKLSQGLEAFEKSGFRPSGFIPPAWLMNARVEQACSDLGFRYTNTLTELIDFQKKRRIPTRSCVWSTRAVWRRQVSRLWNACLFDSLDACEPLRISLHPHDIDYPEIWNQVTQLVARAVKTRTPSTYNDWVREFA